VPTLAPGQGLCVSACVHARSGRRELCCGPDGVWWCHGGFWKRDGTARPPLALHARKVSQIRSKKIGALEAEAQDSKGKSSFFWPVFNRSGRARVGFRRRPPAARAQLAGQRVASWGALQSTHRETEGPPRGEAGGHALILRFLKIKLIFNLKIIITTF